MQGFTYFLRRLFPADKKLLLSVPALCWSLRHKSANIRWYVYEFMFWNKQICELRLTRTCWFVYSQQDTRYMICLSRSCFHHAMCGMGLESEGTLSATCSSCLCATIMQPRELSESLFEMLFHVNMITRTVMASTDSFDESRSLSLSLSLSLYIYIYIYIYIYMRIRTRVHEYMCRERCKHVFDNGSCS